MARMTIQALDVSEALDRDTMVKIAGGVRRPPIIHRFGTVQDDGKMKVEKRRSGLGMWGGFMPIPGMEKYVGSYNPCGIRKGYQKR